MEPGSTGDVEEEAVVRVKVPEARGTLVEYPGYVSNPSRVLETLGGAEALGNACSASAGSTLLELRYRPSDPLSHPLYGERAPANGLVLRVGTHKKRRLRGSSEAEGGNAEGGGDGGMGDADDEREVVVEPVVRVQGAFQFKVRGGAGC